jgi:hypothetical protein
MTKLVGAFRSYANVPKMRIMKQEIRVCTSPHFHLEAEKIQFPKRVVFGTVDDERESSNQLHGLLFYLATVVLLLVATPLRVWPVKQVGYDKRTDGRW